MDRAPIMSREEDKEWETWNEEDIPRKGLVYWKTLISKGVTRSENLTLGLANLPPGGALHEHRHSQDEVYLVLEGSGRVQVGDKELELPGVPGWAGIYGDAAEWDGWSVGLVRESLSVIASAAGEDLEELMEGAREKARLDVISAKSAAERVEGQLQNMRRERLLPDEKTLEKVSRYEAHLSRLMFKALHELEVLQVRRSGGAAPLARLDVDGLAGS